MPHFTDPIAIRALLLAEKTTLTYDIGCATEACCPICENHYATNAAWPRRRRVDGTRFTYGAATSTGHYEGCELDAALAAAGYDTSALRQIGRDMMQREKEEGDG
jgi:hypothetical protein